MRLVSQFDFDGQVSAALLKELGIIDETFLAHPKDLEEDTRRQEPARSLMMTLIKSLVKWQRRLKPNLDLQLSECP
jgi:hypothetical protein|tara:strand:- start:254 stop:481 length:228 start_codon:yes stop_codon:yes gene_type:complete